MSAVAQSGRPRMSHGIALVAVLWVIAALSVVAAGMSALMRSQVRAVTTYQEQVLADAAGDAALNIAVRGLLEKKESVQRYRRVRLDQGEREVEVEIVPISGLISLNGATETLLTDLFVYGGKLAENEANVLAQRVIDWRDTDGVALPKGAENGAYQAAGSRYSTRGGRFREPEDLLQVLGVDLDLYVRIAGLITTAAPHASVDPGAAPEPVLQVLARGNAAGAKLFADKRAGGDARFVIDNTVLANTGGGVTQSVFRLTALVRTPAGHVRQRQRIVKLDMSDNDHYWRTLRVWPSMVVPSAVE